MEWLGKARTVSHLEARGQGDEARARVAEAAEAARDVEEGSLLLASANLPENKIEECVGRSTCTLVSDSD